MNAWVVVKDLKPGQTYTIYRYNDHNNYPNDSNFEDSKYDSKFTFVAKYSMYKYKPDDIMSNSEAYFAAVMGKSET